MKKPCFLFWIGLCFSIFLSYATNATKNRVSLAHQAGERTQHFNLKPSLLFTGRTQELKEISSVLFQQKNNVFLILGVSGIGKTQLIKKYAESYSSRYDLIWWFDANNNMETQADQLLQEIYRRTNKPYYYPKGEALLKKLTQELAMLPLNWLIIFDNVEDFSLVKPYLSFKRKNIANFSQKNDTYTKHVIMTAKKMEQTYPSRIIHKFSREESLAFLSKILGEEKEEDLDALAEALEDFPLALSQAASYIKIQTSLNVRTYLQLLKESQAELWKSEEKLVKNGLKNESLEDDYSKSMLTTIKMNVTSIKEQSPLAYEILCFCSLLNAHHIPLPILERWACGKKSSSKVEFHEAFSLLLNYFFFEEVKSQKNDQDQRLFNQHELIQRVIAHTLSENTKKLLLKEAAECFLQELTCVPATLLEQFQGKEHFYGHMEQICNLAEGLNYKDIQINELKIASLYFIHFFQRDFTESTRLIQLFQNAPQQHDDKGPLAKLWFYTILVNDQTYSDLSKVQESYAKALEQLEKLENQEIKRSYLIHLGADYALSLSNVGRLKEAIALCDDLKETIKKTKNDSQKTLFLGTSALIRLKYGQYTESLQDINTSFELMSNHKALERDIPWIMMAKAHCLFCQGHTQEAYQIIEKYSPLLLEIFGSPENTLMVNANLIKGACLAAFGKLNEALSLVQETLHLYEGTSGYENDTIKGMGYRILGEIFEAQGNLKKAHGEYTKAEALYDKILQEKTLDELGGLYTRLAILGAKQGDDVMTKKYLSLHIEHFGLAHPRTFEIKTYLDNNNLPLP